MYTMLENIEQVYETLANPLWTDEKDNWFCELLEYDDLMENLVREICARRHEKEMQSIFWILSAAVETIWDDARKPMRDAE